MKTRVHLPVFLVKIIDGIQQLLVVTFAEHFADGHQLSFAGAVRPDVAGKFHFFTQITVKRQAFELGFLHRDQIFRQVQQFIGVAFALAFTDFKRVIFGSGFVHSDFLPIESC